MDRILNFYNFKGNPAKLAPLAKASGASEFCGLCKFLPDRAGQLRCGEFPLGNFSA